MKINYTLPNKYKQRGFALIATILVMSMLILLTLAILGISSVETRQSTVNNAQLQAQANARLGLQIALGQLQQSLGPDARATATASILDTDPTTTKIDGVSNPHWLGAYPTINPAAPDDNLLRPKEFRDWSLQNMEWLVSNSDNRNPLDPTVELSADVVTLGQYITDPSVTIPDGTGIDGLAPSLLSKAQAGLVKLDQESGHYAWLVSDESMKARIDTLASIDGSDVLDGSVINTQAQENSNYQISQGNNFSSLLPSYDDTPENIKKILTHNNLHLLGAESTDTSWKNWGKLNQDKFTPYSISLPVDVMNGRLKKDLTAYFKGSYTGLDGQSMIDSRFNLGAGTTPSFSLLKQWATMVDDPTVPQKVVAPSSSIALPEHGLHPLVTQGAVAMKLSYEVTGEKTFNPVYIFMPQIQLWNPHNVPLAAQDYIVKIGYQFQWGMQVKGTRGTDNATFPGGISPAFRSWEELNGQLSLPVHQPANNEDINYQNNKRFFTFVIKAQAFEPGESLLFHAKPPSSGAISGIQYNLSANTDVLDSFSADSDLNLLVNEGNLDEFFYIVSTQQGTLASTSSASPATSLKTESDFQSRTDNSGASNDEDNDMHLNLYTIENGVPSLLHAIKKQQKNTRFGNWQRPTYPLDRYQAGEIFETDTTTFFASKNPLINLGSSMLSSDFDIFAGGGNANTPPSAGQPHSVLGYWNIRNQESFSTSDQWAGASIEANSWLNSFSFRETLDFLAIWESTDNFYGNLSTDRLGGWHQSQIHGMVYPLFDYPTSPYGPLSLGSFQHANLSVHSWQPTYAFGNSQAPPRFNRNSHQLSTQTDLYDVSYLLNASTWDSYYLSTIPQSSITPSSGMRLPNSRQYLTNSNSNADLSLGKIANDIGFNFSAANVLIHGGFNVNSTSHTAWQAFLSGMLGQKVQTLQSSEDSNSETAAAMGRFLSPLLAEPEEVAQDRSNTDFNVANSWAVTRTLNSSEIETLSKRIVEEVKLRGPFLSLSDFVNRRLEPDSNVTGDDRIYQEILGTLQAAINKASVEDQEINYHYYAADNPPSTKMTIKPSQDWQGTMGFSVSQEAQEAMFGLPKSKIDSVGGLIHNYASNFLSQADVLTKIGPSITVRGDTFVIRSYGDSVDSAGRVVATAWCEAVVQRSATPVNWDGTDSTLIQPQNPSQLGFGRNFKLISFRWLKEKDVMPYSDDDSISNQ